MKITKVETTGYRDWDQRPMGRANTARCRGKSAIMNVNMQHDLI